jgi:hypothetical protein
VVEVVQSHAGGSTSDSGGNSGSSGSGSRSELDAPLARQPWELERGLWGRELSWLGASDDYDGRGLAARETTGPPSGDPTRLVGNTADRSSNSSSGSSYSTRSSYTSFSSDGGSGGGLMEMIARRIAESHALLEQTRGVCEDNGSPTATTTPTTTAATTTTS